MNICGQKSFSSISPLIQNLLSVHHPIELDSPNATGFNPFGSPVMDMGASTPHDCATVSTARDLTSGTQVEPPTSRWGASQGHQRLLYFVLWGDTDVIQKVLNVNAIFRCINRGTESRWRRINCFAQFCLGRMLLAYWVLLWAPQFQENNGQSEQVQRMVKNQEAKPYEEWIKYQNMLACRTDVWDTCSNIFTVFIQRKEYCLLLQRARPEPVD